MGKKGLIFAILINVAIVGGLILFVTGMATNTLWLCHAVFAWLGIVGIAITVFGIVVKVKSATDEEKQAFRKQMDETKKFFRSMNKKERIQFILLITLIVTSWVLMIVFSITARITGNYIPMFVCLGIFVGIGPVCILINHIKRR